jgi:hypothetical protein
LKQNLQSPLIKQAPPISNDLTTQKLIVQNELSAYYLKVADDYRERFLDCERQLVTLRATTAAETQQAVTLTEQRLTRLME